jgi:hypothetical protein
MLDVYTSKVIWGASLTYSLTVLDDYYSLGIVLCTDVIACAPYLLVGINYWWICTSWNQLSGDTSGRTYVMSI